MTRFLELGLVDGFHEMAVTGKPVLFTSELAVPIGTGSGPVSAERSRPSDLLANVILPFLHVLAEIQQDLCEADVHLENYGRFGNLRDNELTWEMSELLIFPS